MRKTVPLPVFLFASSCIPPSPQPPKMISRESSGDGVSEWPSALTE